VVWLWLYETKLGIDVAFSICTQKANLYVFYGYSNLPELVSSVMLGWNVVDQVRVFTLLDNCLASLEDI